MVPRGLSTKPNATDALSGHPCKVSAPNAVCAFTEKCQKFPGDRKPGVAGLMGGEDTEKWFLEPENPWILIGTHDMLLSWALIRGCDKWPGTVAG